MASKAKKPAVALAVATPTASAAVAQETAHGYYDTLEQLSRDNLAAVLKANAALAEGIEALAKEASSYARDGFTVAGEAAKGLLAAKTFDQVVEIQAGLAKSGLEALLAGGARLSELGIAAAQSVWTPLGSRVEAALATFAKPVA